MASLCATRAPLATRPAAAQRPCRSIAVRASAAPQKEQRTQKVSQVAQWAAAGLAALYVTAMPAVAATGQPLGVKAKICANNPTAKICLRNSFAK